MKLYTEEQVRQVWHSAYIDALALDEDDYKPNFYDDFIKTITPIELPSDEEIDKKFKPRVTMYELGYVDGAKWTKELILKQNTFKENVQKSIDNNKVELNKQLDEEIENELNK